MNISINEIDSSMALRVEGQIYFVVEYNHVKPGKGSAFVRVRLKNVKTGLTLERTFRSAESLETVPLEEKSVQYQYQAGDMYHFMDQESFEEITVPKDLLGNVVNLLQDNMVLSAIYCDHKLQKINLPNFMVVQVVETEPGYKGDSSKSSGKPAKIDTGATLLVPLFINVGDWIKIDTRDGNGQYVERAQR